MSPFSPEMLAQVYDELAAQTSTESLVSALLSHLTRGTNGRANVWMLDQQLRSMSAQWREEPSAWPPLRRALRESFDTARPHELLCEGSQRPENPPEHSRHALVLPLAVRGEVQAVILIEQGAPFGEARGPLVVFAKAVAGLLVQLRERHRAAATAKLAQALPGQGAEEASRSALDHLRRFTPVKTVTLLDYRDATLRPSGRDDRAPSLPVEWPPSMLHSLRHGEPSLGEDFMLCPVAGRHRARRALWAEFGTAKWSQADAILFQMVARLLGSALERFDVQAQLSSQLRLQRELLSVPPEGLYLPLLQEAVRLVPGAGAGSLLVRVDDRFHYRAWVGYEREELQDVSFMVSDTRDTWYGLDDAAWLAGVPRVLSQGSIVQQGAGYQVQSQLIAACLPSTHLLHANLCVPILYQGQVYAVLNLDSVRDPDAFGADSVDVARAFAAQAAALIHHAEQRQLIENAARTDTLTGLPNRRAFNEALTRAVKGAGRNLQPVSMLVLDLSGFKGINDRFGHAAGDQVLVQIAQALQQQLRGEDQVFRWGGDEFAVLLPFTDGRGAVQVAGRLADSVGELSTANTNLRANIGIATACGEALCGETLLRQADAAMYRAKASGRPYAISSG
ncbi:GGDEF domain-containing protein [Deinococcus peraridilitoris]|uniref:Diguanylate cyclase (GGDEF) domain-containing protein n=1 Tax=Deinococcus peraridilitoris (strain DSM 19664 / LMG 22246 / CIP 109416 / KR-200) TaxID=937777 RepID=L0A4R6_DEIPD|nr:sensor domain-containing diguanylate cyclase [Deinococcus peraridilitoris]AFZ68878.1 diguanylate cyclase (GGDEF) domain-containing protein [Deinococcus peraridilitoris DSM 19664]